MTSLRHDLRVGLRSLRRTPGFTLAAVLSLALGIGLSTAVFTVAEALLLRRLPVLDEDRVVVVAGVTPDGRTENVPLDLQAARDFTRGSRALGTSALFMYEGAVPESIREGDRISRLRRSLVSGDFFAVLGAQPVLGRALRPEDDAAGAAPVLVISHRAWRDRFGGARDVIGREITMHDDGMAYRVVGVMPQGLDFPRGVDAWGTALAAVPPANVRYLSFNVVGRLAPGATAATARDEMTAFFGRDGAPAWQRGVRGGVRSLGELVVGDTRRAVLVFAAAAGLLLLITCVNVANLLLVRGLARTREIAVRLALGATRGKVVRGLLAEHALLAITGGLLGLAVALVAVRAFVAFAPAGLPRLDEIGVNPATLAGGAAITGIAMLLFAVVPALTTSGVNIEGTLRTGAPRGASRRSRRASETLVAGQVALALLVLSAAGLIGRSLVKLENAELSFDGSSLLVGELTFRGDQYETLPKQIAMIDGLVAAVGAIPGVRSVSPVIAPPYGQGGGWDGTFKAEGQSADDAAANPLLNIELVAPSYFATVGTRALRGREFTEADREGAPGVVMLSETAARHYWPTADPVGKRLLVGPPTAPRPLTVVGIVPDIRYRELRQARASVYFPLRQSFFPFAPSTLLVRATGAPASLVPSLRQVIRETAPGVELASAAPFETFLAAPLAQPRLNAFLLLVFAGAAVALASIGLFSVMATMVRQRTREFGVRMAVGATASDIARTVLRRGMALAAAGTAIGLVAALATNRLLAAMLFETSPTDALTLAAASLLLIGVAALASVVPARSSTRIDPAVALRAE
jgi:putative ABC transport system permease protein